MRTKTFVLASVLVLASSQSFAGNNSLIVNYPAVQGVYNKIILSTNAVDCSQPQNQGSLFLYSNGNNQSLELCATNGSSVTVPYHETCFNRFCSSATKGCGTSLTCFSSQYAKANINSNEYDEFSPDGSLWVDSIVCCDANSAVLPT